MLVGCNVRSAIWRPMVSGRFRAGLSPRNPSEPHKLQAVFVNHRVIPATFVLAPSHSSLFGGLLEALDT